ncbi:cytochrome b5 [Dissophora ornata]|nr:cytochrome b5 [Dissophora ornata]
MATKIYTTTDLAVHNTKHSLFLAIHGKVYDISEFVDEHPGGEEVLLEEAGRDATEAFEDVGHSDEAREIMKRFAVGVYQLSGTEKPRDKPRAATPKPIPHSESSTSGR